MADTRPLLARAVYDEMRHALGGASDLRKQELLGDVLSTVTSMHQWDFLSRGEAYVDLRGQVSFSSWSWTASSKTLFDPGAGSLLAPYTYYPTDLVYISAGGTTGHFGVASKVDDDTLTLDKSISSVDLSASVGGKVIPRCHPLPVDFRQLIDAGFVNNESYLGLTSKTKVARSQRNERIQSLAYSASVEWIDHNTPALRFDPSPVTGSISSVSIVYRRRLALVGDDGDEINAPEFMHRLIKDVARALSRGLEMPLTYGDFDVQLDRIKKMPVFLDAVNADGGSQADLGRICEGGHAPRKVGYSHTWPPATISITGP